MCVVCVQMFIDFVPFRWLYLYFYDLSDSCLFSNGYIRCLGRVVETVCGDSYFCNEYIGARFCLDSRLGNRVAPV